MLVRFLLLPLAATLVWSPPGGALPYPDAEVRELCDNMRALNSRGVSVAPGSAFQRATTYRYGVTPYRYGRVFDAVREAPHCRGVW